MLSQELENVGFWARVGASIIDMLFQLMIVLPLTYAVYGRFYGTERMFMGAWDVLITWVLPAVAVMAFWIIKGATPGKMAMSARVVDADTGEPLRLGQSLIRYFGYFVSLIPLFVGFLWIAFDRRRQGWHDKLANSVVVRPSGQEPVKFRGKAEWRVTL